MSKARFVSAPALVPLDTTPCTPEQMRATHMLLSVLLDYPGEKFDQALAAAVDLPAPIQADLDQFVAWAQEAGERDVRSHYVDIFDQQRRCALYLSYYVAGDTRLRGSAILGFRQFLTALGYELDRDELDDYLPVILELSALSGDHLVWELLASHREGIEVMRSALYQAESPYRHLLDALARTLPEVDADTYERFQRLVTQGPPTEMVGAQLSTPWPTRSHQ
ncbi:nitrate reductase molybdenum cofactor assembly chaperone [Scrofimicrobium sp. R131]|uniref:Nitrate reductase molybdenum cofactor assembly chaperone n=1 Tax=Scrofimicrobium appendicitidis TaxID=3079930 RepID=A0AAU7V6E2_9ACTO